ncbi:CoA-transferase subunit beta [Halogeometricum sp. CBA1124]|uniref:CoA-transferase subunit beta n=1 Tax=Halogeometricum sp. CBA1124 TaxID=2668071 RepID=UPI00142BD317|nr:CoA-transferase [Halogeometricum sp. CBA1124]MUV56198.1 CoA-transferase subunit beta [Halogeometricum sp. CBA1124]
MSDLYYTDTELMITRAALELGNDDTVLVGVGVPNLACNLAKQTHAPDLEMVYESGTVDSDPDALPLSIGDPVLATGARSIVTMYDGFGRYLQAGRIDVGFLGGAQIDRWGNINSTVIGDYDDPKVRLPGSGGACEIASNARRTLIIAPHQRRRFPEEVDFVTSPGYVGGRKGRDERGLRGGPEAVITDMAVMKFDDAGEMYVETIHPGVTREAVQEATGWDLAFADDVTETPTPEADEIRLIREELDPDGIYTGGDE